ncbi:hypothetical protein [Polaribacter gochangensis]|uniref:hypothetical protein n=1 Tax=Polaribacter gochangensis TaxID=3252903 RepID=UPI0039046CD7
METTVQLDLRRFISAEAAESKSFEVKLAGNIKIGIGSWLQVDSSEIKVLIEGEYLNQQFEITIIITKISDSTLKINISGSINASGQGLLQRESNDELKIVELDLDNSNLSSIKQISLTRWKHNETRASVCQKILFDIWTQTWWV